MAKFHWLLMEKDGLIVLWQSAADAGEMGSVVDLSLATLKEPEFRAQFVEKHEEEPWAADPGQGYVLTFKGSAEERPHQLCGENSISGADCQECGITLTLVALSERDRLPFSFSVRR